VARALLPTNSNHEKETPGRKNRAQDSKAKLQKPGLSPDVSISRALLPAPHKQKGTAEAVPGESLL
jgi:hypothetical protein